MVNRVRDIDCRTDMEEQTVKCALCRGKGCGYCHGSGSTLVGGWDESNERYTPQTVIDLAKKVIGHINIDPASCEYANSIVDADVFYDYRQDGLKHKWYGSGWCNPPYGIIKGMAYGYQQLFSYKAVEEYNAGRLKQMILLLNGLSPYRGWFKELEGHPMCLYEHNVVYYNKDTEKLKHGFGSCFLYIGPSEDTFYDVFSPYGLILKAMKSSTAR